MKYLVNVYLSVEMINCVKISVSIILKKTIHLALVRYAIIHLSRIFLVSNFLFNFCWIMSSRKIVQAAVHVQISTVLQHQNRYWYSIRIMKGMCHCLWTPMENFSPSIWKLTHSLMLQFLVRPLSMANSTFSVV